MDVGRVVIIKASHEIKAVLPKKFPLPTLLLDPVGTFKEFLLLIRIIKLSTLPIGYTAFAPRST